MTLDLTVLLAGVLTVFIAGILKGSVGFGFPLVAVPLLTLLVGPKTAVILVSVPMAVSNILLIVRRPFNPASLKRLLPLLVTLLPATIAGSVVLSTVSAQPLTILVGTMAILAGILSLARIRPSIPRRVEAPVSAAIGAVAGLLSGATSISGPLLATYLSSLHLDPRSFVYGITLIFTVSNTTQVVSYTRLGLLGADLFLPAILLIPTTLLGQQVGFTLQDRLEPEGFRRIVAIAVMVSGWSLLARGLGLLT